MGTAVAATPAHEADPLIKAKASEAKPKQRARVRTISEAGRSLLSAAISAPVVEVEPSLLGRQKVTRRSTTTNATKRSRVLSENGRELLTNAITSAESLKVSDAQKRGERSNQRLSLEVNTSPRVGENPCDTVGLSVARVRTNSITFG